MAALRTDVQAALRERGYAPTTRGSFVLDHDGVRTEVLAEKAGMLVRACAEIVPTLEICAPPPEGTSRRHLCGDGAFDTAVLARGPFLHTLSALSGTLRQDWALLVDRGGFLRLATVHRPLAEDTPLYRVGIAAGATVELAKAVAARTADPVRSVAESAGRDLDPLVRRTCLEALALMAPDEPAARTAFLVALDDDDPACKLTGAIELGEAGRKTCRRMTVDREAISSQRIRALHAQAEGLATADARRLLDAFLGDPVLGEAASWEMSLLAFEGREPAPCPPTVAAALAAFPSRIGERFFLAYARDARAGASCLGALARMGTPASIPALTVLGDDDSAARELRLIAKHALGRIQARDANAAPGQLTVIEKGQLSEADADIGRLSPSPRKR